MRTLICYCRANINPHVCAICIRCWLSGGTFVHLLFFMGKQNVIRICTFSENHH